MTDALRLFGLKAIVTEAGSGIGEAIVRTFVKHGAEVFAVDSESSDIENHFRKLSGVTARALDMHARDAPRKVLAAAKSVLGALDIVVANFDWHGEAPIDDADAPAIDALTSNMKTLISGICDAMLPAMQKSPAGRIIVVACLRSVFAKDGEKAYRESERALRATMSSLAQRTGEFGIMANVVQPGAAMTPVSRRVFAANKDLRDYCIQESAARRLAEPVDIAKVALFLATDDSGFVSGTVIRADGGVNTNE
jgi:NAD(P)-dependent dehydrogenase (short-subunit alcohol dehydrogenase family)